MNAIEAIILGLVQGLTEFLPVSSSGHLTIAKELFGIDTGNLSFEVMVHAATVCSTIVAFRKEILDLLKGLFSMSMNPQKEYVLKIVISMVPIFIVGVFFKDEVEAVFGSGLMVVGCMLLLTALLLTLSEWLSRRNAGQGHPVTVKDAIIIGIAQAIAVLPGLSRSGTTISTGLMLGVKKADVAQFSFLMVLVPILGEAFLELVGGEFSGAISGIPTLSLVLGFVSAFLSGLFACTLMINIVKRAKLWLFAIYCVVAGVSCIVSTLL
ncbi:MAG: undecaprenyl-diphosphate phosphatase [Bacteroidales bacterium]|nr:undecaprenyl-diphosphate phosphatase [Bacteroidales bacterium]